MSVMQTVQQLAGAGTYVCQSVMTISEVGVPEDPCSTLAPGCQPAISTDSDPMLVMSHAWCEMLLWMCKPHGLSTTVVANAVLK